MLLNIYLWGALFTAMGALVASRRLAGIDAESPLSRAAVAAVAGALWPVLIVGIVQFVCIAGLVGAIRTRAVPATPHQQPLLREETPLAAGV